MADMVLKALKTLIVRIPEKLAMLGARVTYLEKKTPFKKNSRQAAKKGFITIEGLGRTHRFILLDTVNILCSSIQRRSFEATVVRDNRNE